MESVSGEWHPVGETVNPFSSLWCNAIFHSTILNALFAFHVCVCICDGDWRGVNPHPYYYYFLIFRLYLFLFPFIHSVHLTMQSRLYVWLYIWKEQKNKIKLEVKKWMPVPPFINIDTNLENSWFRLNWLLYFDSKLIGNVFNNKNMMAGYWLFNVDNQEIETRTALQLNVLILPHGRGNMTIASIHAEEGHLARNVRVAILKC